MQCDVMQCYELRWYGMLEAIRWDGMISRTSIIPELTMGGKRAAEMATPIKDAKDDPTLRTEIPTPKPLGIAMSKEVKTPDGVPRLIIS